MEQIAKRYTVVNLAALMALSVAALGLMVTTSGCGQQPDTNTPEQIASALELENGGLTEEDETPAFGEAEAFDESAEEVEMADVIDAAPELNRLREREGVAVYHTKVLWGQIPGNRENRIAHDWSGSFSVNRGAIIVRRTIAFEEGTDEVFERDSRQDLRFASKTRPHFDGLRLLIIDPSPNADEALVLSYLGADGLGTRIDVRKLLVKAYSWTIDDARNRMLAVALRRPIDPCDHGFVRGLWRQADENHGRFIGRVANVDGNPLGHIRGIYGIRRNGKQVLFGKYIDLDGQFRGIFRGTYGAGEFQARWLHRSGDVGALAGVYRESAPGDAVGGHFLGRWAETSCRMDVADTDRVDPQSIDRALRLDSHANDGEGRHADGDSDSNNGRRDADNNLR